MLQKFIYWTGAFDFVIAAGCWYGAISNPAAGYFVSLMTLGMFLAMAAACLMWASKDMVNRSPVIFWQGLVRLTAISAVLYGVPNGLATTPEYALVIFDGTIGLVYILGMMKVTGSSIIGLLLCQSKNSQ